MGAILEAGGSGFDKVVKTTVLLANMGDFATVNAIYGKIFCSSAPACRLGCRAPDFKR
jgi:2-iminobutanoate/2-iminopropanoate deaminase